MTPIKILSDMKHCLLIATMFFCTTLIFSQNDSLILKNNDVIIGELKSMDRGVVKFETDYSDSDFKIEWNGIKEVYTTSYYMLTLSDGTRLNGRLESSGDKLVKLIFDNGSSKEVNIDDVVFLKSVDKGFWDQVYASIDIGLEITRANHLSTFSTRSNVGYLAQRWSLDINFNTLISTQDSTEKISRTDGGITYKYYLPKDWYIPVTVTYLSNTEQKLDARWNSLLGIGKFIIHTNRVYWGVAIGGSYNIENYSPLDEPKTHSQSWEGYIGTEMNLFDIGDLSFFTKARAYPSFTDAGRWRSDFSLDTKYDLPMDFYVKVGISIDYDNQPVVGASALDYVFYTGFGWEW